MNAVLETQTLLHGKYQIFYSMAYRPIGIFHVVVVVYHYQRDGSTGSNEALLMSNVNAVRNTHATSWQLSNVLAAAWHIAK